MKKILLCIFLLTAVSLLSCRDQINSPQNGGVYTPEPFTTDTTWVYSVDSYDSTGALSSTKMDTLTIDSVSITNEQKRVTFSDGTAVILDTNGALWTLLKYHPNICECTMIVIPAKTGDTIYKTSGIPIKINGKVGVGTINAFIKDVDQIVTVPAGKFTSFIFEIDLTLVGSTAYAKVLTYINPTVGVVQRDYYETDSSGTLYLMSRSQLKSLK